MIVMYDLEENFLDMFDTYEDCAKYFDTTIDVIYVHIHNTARGIITKKRDKKHKKWVKLYKIDNKS